MTPSLFAALRRILVYGIAALVLLQWYTQSVLARSWQQPLDVQIHVINLGQSDEAKEYARSLQRADFVDIEHWLQEQARRYGVQAPPVRLRMGDPLSDPPPAPPSLNRPAAAFQWSLAMRAWVTQQVPDTLWKWRRAQIFYVVNDADAPRLLHSVGLARGMIGVVQARGHADLHDRNMVIMAHELLHTVGATDKYNARGLPVYPHGYAKPDQVPLYPQPAAEITAARMALTPNRALLAPSLQQAFVGELTAQEIGWLREEEGQASVLNAISALVERG